MAHTHVQQSLQWGAVLSGVHPLGKSPNLSPSFVGGNLKYFQDYVSTFIYRIYVCIETLYVDQYII